MFDNSALLLTYLNKMSTWDLERLKSCFKVEYKYHPENKANIDDVISHIDCVLAEKAG